MKSYKKVILLHLILPSCPKQFTGHMTNGLTNGQSWSSIIYINFRPETVFYAQVMQTVVPKETRQNNHGKL